MVREAATCMRKKRPCRLRLSFLAIEEEACFVLGLFSRSVGE